MHITVNGREVEIFAGARVADAVRKFSRAEWTRVRKNEKAVCDRHGHEVGLDGELHEGEALVVKPRVPEESRS